MGPVVVKATCRCDRRTFLVQLHKTETMKTNTSADGSACQVIMAEIFLCCDGLRGRVFSWRVRLF
jgi:hypothetical protein